MRSERTECCSLFWVKSKKAIFKSFPFSRHPPPARGVNKYLSVGRDPICPVWRSSWTLVVWNARGKRRRGGVTPFCVLFSWPKAKKEEEEEKDDDVSASSFTLLSSSCVNSCSFHLSAVQCSAVHQAPRREEQTTGTKDEHSRDPRQEL